jgi:hypothetical protein
VTLHFHNLQQLIKTKEQELHLAQQRIANLENTLAASNNSSSGASTEVVRQLEEQVQKEKSFNKIL